MFVHIEQEHKRQLKKEGTLYAARRVDALNRNTINVIDPARTNRHVDRHREQLGELTKLVKGIVRRCLLEARAIHGDERRQDRSTEIKDEYEKLLRKNPSVFDPVELKYY